MIIRQLRFTKTAQTPTGETLELKYFLLLNISVREYGVAVRLRRNGCTETAQYTAITPDCARAEALLERLAEGLVTPVSFADVIQDWL